MTYSKNYDIVLADTKNNTFTERKSIMRIIASAMSYKSECKASFFSEEYGFAKHAHFRDKQNRYGMIS